MARVKYKAVLLALNNETFLEILSKFMSYFMDSDEVGLRIYDCINGGETDDVVNMDIIYHTSEFFECWKDPYYIVDLIPHEFENILSLLDEFETKLCEDHDLSKVLDSAFYNLGIIVVGVKNGRFTKRSNRRYRHAC